MWAALVTNIIVVVTVVGAFGLRIEHRLTSIETDIKWLKELITSNCNKEKENKNELE